MKNGEMVFAVSPFYIGLMRTIFQSWKTYKGAFSSAHVDARVLVNNIITPVITNINPNKKSKIIDMIPKIIFNTPKTRRHRHTLKQNGYARA